MDATRIADHAGQDLEWTQPHWARPEFELRAGSEVLATLRRRHWWGSELLAESDGETWRLVEPLLQPSLLAFRAGDTSEAAIVRPVGWRGEDRAPHLEVARWRGDQRIELASGDALWFRQASVWRPAWQLVDADGVVWVDILRMRQSLRVTGTLRVESVARERPELGLLVMIGWCLALATTHQHTH